MGKGKQRPPMYNRPSGGYQKNLYKQQMKEKNIEIPKPIDYAKITKISRILMVVWLIATFILIFAVDWKMIFISAAIALAYGGGLVYYMNDWQKKFVTAYKKMGMPRDMFIKQLKKNGTDKKSLDKIIKTWDKVKVD